MQDRSPGSVVVGGFHGKGNRMAADTAPQRIALLLGSRDTQEPLYIGKLGGKIASGTEPQVHVLGAASSDLHRARVLQIVTDGSDTDAIWAGLQPASRKSVTAPVVGDNGDRHRAALSFGGNQDSLHLTFSLRSDPATEYRIRGVGVAGLCRAQAVKRGS